MIIKKYQVFCNGATNIANALHNAKFPNLTNLCLEWNKIEDVGASNIINAQWSSLTRLNLSYNEIVERNKLKVLQLQCPSLKELILSLRRGSNKYCKCDVLLS